MAEKLKGGRMRCHKTFYMRVISLGLIVLLYSVPAMALTSHRSHRKVKPPISQGYWSGYGGHSLELHGLRVPVVVKTESHYRIMELAGYWATLTGAHLRIVSAMDHIHARKSAHYAGKAIDFQGEQLDDLARWFRGFGYKVYWHVRGHYHHVHVEERLGAIQTPE